MTQAWWPRPLLTRVCLTQVVVVQAISALCQKYPRKHAVLMNFLFTMLREEVRAGPRGTPGLLVQGAAWCEPPSQFAAGSPLWEGVQTSP